MEDNLPGSVREIESEAKRILEEARTGAAEILRNAHEQAEAIAAGDLPLDEVGAECAALIRNAREQAERTVKDAENTARALSATAASRVDACVAELVRIVSRKDA